MISVNLRWIGDLDQDKREQAGCVSSSSDQYRPRKIELRPDQRVIRIGRINSKSPPDYPIESCINNRMISRNHATIERSTKGGSILYDHSMNGTYVNYTRVMGGVSLKDGDVVCFGHLNGANLKPGDTVPLFYSDLKYRVELTDISPIKKEQPISTKKRKSRPNQPGSNVSSTQQSGDDNSSVSDNEVKVRKSVDKKAKRVRKGDETIEDVKRIALKPAKPSTPSRALKAKPDTDRKQGRGDKSHKKSESDGSADDNLHADTEECSARPCKNPQDAAIMWIQCDSCEKWYHQSCLGISIPDDSSDNYYCPFCKPSG